MISCLRSLTFSSWCPLDSGMIFLLTSNLASKNRGLKKKKFFVSHFPRRHMPLVRGGVSGFCIRIWGYADRYFEVFLEGLARLLSALVSLMDVIESRFRNQQIIIEAHLIASFVHRYPNIFFFRKSNSPLPCGIKE